MSTKIHAGIKFKSKNIHEVFDGLAALREDAKKLALEELRGWLDEDGLYISTDMKNGSRFFYKVLKAVFEKYPKTAFDADVELTVRILPHKDGTLYGYYFGFNRKAEDLVLNCPIVEDFSYQNQTDDRPKGVSKKKYEARGKIWEELLKPYGAKFSECSLGFCVVDHNIIFWEILKVVKEWRDSVIDNWVSAAHEYQ